MQIRLKRLNRTFDSIAENLYGKGVLKSQGNQEEGHHSNTTVKKKNGKALTRLDYQNQTTADEMKRTFSGGAQSTPTIYQPNLETSYFQHYRQTYQGNRSRQCSKSSQNWKTSGIDNISPETLKFMNIIQVSYHHHFQNRNVYHQTDT